MKIVIFGLTVRSSWGNGHATTWRAPLHQLIARGRDVAFFERDVGTLINAWIARGGSALGVRAGESYVDVATLNGYREGIGLLSPAHEAPVRKMEDALT
jgi:hypothetical protein